MIKNYAEKPELKFYKVKISRCNFKMKIKAI